MQRGKQVAELFRHRKGKPGLWQKSSTMFYSPTHVLEPQGPHSVSCVDVATDELLVRLFYPTEKRKGEQTVQWLPSVRYVQGYCNALNIWSPLGSVYYNIYLNRIKVPASWASPLLPGAQLPVVVFSHGLMGTRFMYSSTALELASHGWVVAAPEHRDGSACASLLPGDSWEEEYLPHEVIPQGQKQQATRTRQVRHRALECRRALDLLEEIGGGISGARVKSQSLDLKQFQGRLDFNSAVIAGHSFGGSTAMLALATDSRFKAGVGLDSWMFALRLEHETLCASTQPMLLIVTDEFRCAPQVRALRKLCINRGPNTIAMTMRKTRHQHQSDMPLVVGSLAARFVAAYSSVPPEIPLRLSNLLVLQFLAKYREDGMKLSEKSLNYIDKYRHLVIDGVPPEGAKL